MENFQVKLVDFEEKSVQQVEETLLKVHEEKTGITQIEEPETLKVQIPSEPDTAGDLQGEEQSTPQSPSFDDEDVLSYIRSKYNREVNSIDDLFKPVEAPQELLPEDVSAFLKFKKETGRGLEDFYRVNQDFSNEKPERLLATYLKELNPELDDEDIQYEMSDRFGYDEEEDDERDIKKKKLALKKELTKATKYFDEQKEKYRAPLESSGINSVSMEDQLALESYKQYTSQASAQQQEQAKRSEYFVQKSNELFSNEFEGFKFGLGDKDVSWKPGNAEDLKNKQMDISKFFNNFVDDNGFIKDAKSYHKTMAVAMNPDSFAKFFYEQGKSDAIDDSARQSKNIDMGSVRTTGQPIDKGGFKVTSLDSDHGNRLKIRKL
jgi:hypothetical protein